MRFVTSGVVVLSLLLLPIVFAIGCGLDSDGGSGSAASGASGGTGGTSEESATQRAARNICVCGQPEEDLAMCIAFIERGLSAMGCTEECVACLGDAACDMVQHGCDVACSTCPGL